MSTILLYYHPSCFFISHSITSYYYIFILFYIVLDIILSVADSDIWATFQPKLEKQKKIYFKQISYIFSEKGFIFWEIELSQFWKHKKIHSEEISHIFFFKMFFLYFRKYNFLTLRWKISYIFSEKSFSYILEMELFKKTSYISGGNFPSSEKISYILVNESFLRQA